MAIDAASAAAATNCVPPPRSLMRMGPWFLWSLARVDHRQRDQILRLRRRVFLLVRAEDLLLQLHLVRRALPLAGEDVDRVRVVVVVRPAAEAVLPLVLV